MGVGRIFESKKVIGERQAIVSKRNLESLGGAKIGDQLTLHYDLKLLLSMI